MKTVRLPCGCRHEIGGRERIVESCETHEAEWREIHDRWATEHRNNMAEFYRPRETA